MKKITLCMVLAFVSVCVNSQTFEGKEFHFGRGSTSWKGWGSTIYLEGVGDYSDPVSISKYCIGNDTTQMRITVGDHYYGGDCLVIGRAGGLNDSDDSDWTGYFYFYNDGYFGLNNPNPHYEMDINGTIRSNKLLVTEGNVGIGTFNPQNKLDVNGTIRAKEIKVESGWADFVFKEGYKLPSLDEVRKHIDDKGTLPGVPSEKEIKENGMKVGETNAMLLQKIEELTLYILDLKQEIDDLKKEKN